MAAPGMPEGRIFSGQAILIAAAVVGLGALAFSIFGNEHLRNICVGVTGAFIITSGMLVRSRLRIVAGFCLLILVGLALLGLMPR